MAFLKKYIDKYTFMLISGVWTSLSAYIPIHFHWAPETIVLLITIGNLVIQWIALETSQNHKKHKETAA